MHVSMVSGIVIVVILILRIEFIFCLNIYYYLAIYAYVFFGCERLNVGFNDGLNRGGIFIL